MFYIQSSIIFLISLVLEEFIKKVLTLSTAAHHKKRQVLYLSFFMVCFDLTLFCMLQLFRTISIVKISPIVQLKFYKMNFKYLL